MVLSYETAAAHVLSLQNHYTHDEEYVDVQHGYGTQFRRRLQENPSEQ